MHKRVCIFIFLSISFISACIAFTSPVSIQPTQIPPTQTADTTVWVETLSPTDTPIPPTDTAIPLTNTPITPTLVPTNTPISVVRFAVIGDFGLAGKPEQDVAHLITSWQPDFIITVGDNNYPIGAQETIDENIGQYYHQYIFPYTGSYGQGADINRFFPTLGNHDWISDKAQPHYDYFSLPGNERYYDVVWGPVHLFALDSDSREPDGVGASSIQASWLKEKLAASTSPWKIVYMHHPPYSSAYHGSTDWMQWPYKEWGATTVISGHDHTYERLIINDFPYFINGLGGYTSRYWFVTTLEGSQIRYREDYGAMLISASEAEITFQFITRNGNVIDTYTIHGVDTTE